MAAKSKKGSAFERETCKLLSLWFTYGERDDIFWRTDGSGSRATVRAKQGKSTANSVGDISALSIIGKPLTDVAVFELKKGYSVKSPSKRVSLLSFIDNLPSEKSPLLLQWAEKVEKERKTHSRKFWFIIFKRDRKQAVICMLKDTFQAINRKNPERYIWPPFGSACDIYLEDKIFRLMLLEDFLKWCRPDTIQRKISRRGKPITKKQWEELVCCWRTPDYKPNLTKAQKRSKPKGKPIDQIQAEHQRRHINMPRKIRRRLDI